MGRPDDDGDIPAQEAAKEAKPRKGKRPIEIFLKANPPRRASLLFFTYCLRSPITLKVVQTHGHAFFQSRPRKKHSHSNPAVRSRRLRSVSELRVRFRPTYTQLQLVLTGIKPPCQRAIAGAGTSVMGTRFEANTAIAICAVPLFSWAVQHAHNVYQVGRSEYGVVRVNHSQSIRRAKPFGWRSLHRAIESRP
jgi:hypothetical protein